MKKLKLLFLLHVFLAAIAIEACKTNKKLENNESNKKTVLADSINSAMIGQNKQQKHQIKDSISNRNKSVQVNNTIIYYLVDEKPQFPGGDIELNYFIAKNIDFKNVGTIEPWGTALIKFVVTKDGGIENIQIINKDNITDIIEERIINVIKLFPNLTPGKIQGRPVATWKIIKINEPN